MADTSGNDFHNELTSCSLQNKCSSDTSSINTRSPEVLSPGIEIGKVHQTVPIAPDDIMDTTSDRPVCAVDLDMKDNAEIANSESFHREDHARAVSIIALPYSPPELRRPFKPSNSKRQQLIAKEAAEIYLLRPRSKAGRLIPRGSMAHCKVKS
jgi:hypothetical protein